MQCQPCLSPEQSPPSPPRIPSLIVRCIGSGHQGYAEKGDSSGGPGCSSCSGVSKEPRVRYRGGSEGRTVKDCLPQNQPLVVVGQAEAWSIIMELGAPVQKANGPSMAGVWARPRTTGHTSGRPTRTDDGAGELGPPTVRTVHSSGAELWVMLWLGSAVDYPSPRRRRRGRHSTRVGSPRSQHIDGRYWQMPSPPNHRTQDTRFTRSAVPSQNR